MITRTTTELLAGLGDVSNTTAWHLFNRRYRPIVVNYAKRCGLQEADAEDVTQETMAEFLRAYRSGHYNRERGSRLRDWLKGIAVNRVREFRRRRAKSKERQIPASDSQTDFLLRLPDKEQLSLWDQEWTTHILSECLRAVRAEFDAKTLRAFKLYAIRQRSADDVAKELGMTRNAVYIAKNRVLDRMHTIFNDHDGQQDQAP
jgi:RNA polymerase sigma-70 factor (ECF subfamily)